MAHHSYEDAKKFVFKGLWLLAAVTLLEVFISLIGKGHVTFITDNPGTTLIVIASLIIIVLSIYKAYFIVYFFMHLGSEVRGLRWSVLLPCLLLVWAIIAFFQEGSSWGERRDQIQKFNEAPAESSQGNILYDEETYKGLI